MDLQPGQIVHVRSREYLVEGVVPPPKPADSPLVRLSCVEDDALGETLEVCSGTRRSTPKPTPRRTGRPSPAGGSTSRVCSRPTSNDPTCAQHDPANRHEERFLHGAACHGCLLIAETSCERRNEFLDRALVVRTVSTPDRAFFDGEAG